MTIRTARLTIILILLSVLVACNRPPLTEPAAHPSDPIAPPSVEEMTAPAAARVPGRVRFSAVRRSGIVGGARSAPQPVVVSEASSARGQPA